MERLIDTQLIKLKKRLIKMGSLVEEQIEGAIRSVDTEDLELAEKVIQGDQKVDKFDRKIEKTCQKVLALNQPVAMDLRLLMSAMSLDMNLERMGDNAVSIAQFILEMKKKPSFFSQTKFNEMSQLAKKLVKNSIDSFVDYNANYAKQVIELDSSMDNLNETNRQIIIDIMKQDVNNVEAGVAMLGISRMMERLGDLSKNIAEDVIFIVEANLIKHKYEKYLFADDDEEDESSEE
ncbi:MAG: phosphate signaling complex protein PhoU [Ignavibacteriaceae bacterium]